MVISVDVIIGIVNFGPGYLLLADAIAIGNDISRTNRPLVLPLNYKGAKRKLKRFQRYQKKGPKWNHKRELQGQLSDAIVDRNELCVPDMLGHFTMEGHRSKDNRNDDNEEQDAASSRDDAGKYASLQPR